ncbi:succinate dehydrogenase assembly factor 2 [Pontivivens nitratireducens]|uniref:FAD assembly factor SdhE n=1 Tax=Pontivivens nitratireducens TaxID=2758038 RepID=A0A6G7VMB8_9RHOB|nr:succinate dehydrogenase assembly factor 2 [Pontibrevibacter nitratireducens]QIK41189.1 succinate dehydrogenase assembly factor 2 [Pontibrevibacter nitratireducens]
MTETHENRLKRLRIRSWRRGTKEMDLILGPYADADLAALPVARIDDYEELLEESDHDLYSWFSGREDTPPRHVEMISTIMEGRQFR